MTFLDICKAVRQKSGISGDGPSSVISQTGIMQRVVEWVLDAEQEIISINDQAQFLREINTGALVDGDYRYTANSLNMSPTRLINKAYVDNFEIEVVKYQEWLDNITEYGDSTKTGTPTVVTLTPDQRLEFWPTPNSALAVKIDSYILPTAMTTNTSVSIIPELYHKAIMYKALMFYADYEEDMYLYQRAEQNFDKWMASFYVDQLPKSEFNRSLLFG